METQNKLIVEDLEVITFPEAKPEAEPEAKQETEPGAKPEAESDIINNNANVPKETSQADTANLSNILSNIEYEFIKCLLHAKNYSDFIKSNGLMLSVLIDSINEKLFDMFCDTVLIFNGDKPELVEDYEDELKEIIRE